MTPYYKLPSLAGSVHLADTNQSKQPNGKIDTLLSIGALRLVNGLESAIRWSVGEINRLLARRTMIQELQALSDHHLTDIGLDRSQIVATVEEITGPINHTVARIIGRGQRGK